MLILYNLIWHLEQKHSCSLHDSRLPSCAHSGAIKLGLITIQTLCRPFFSLLASMPTFLKLFTRSNQHLSAVLTNLGPNCLSPDEKKTHLNCTLVSTLFPEYFEMSRRSQKQSAISGFTLQTAVKTTSIKKIISQILISLFFFMCAHMPGELHFINGS